MLQLTSQLSIITMFGPDKHKSSKVYELEKLENVW